MKRKMALIMAAFMLMGSVPTNIMANDKETVATAKVVSPLSITVTPNLVDKNIKNFEISDITIKEAEAGILTKGKSLYFKADNLQFEDGATFEVVSGNVKISDVSTKNGVLRIDIDKSSSGEPSEILISNLKLFVEGSLPNGVYPLDLITEESDNFTNNMFGEVYGDKNESGKFDVSSVTAISNFVTVNITGDTESISNSLKINAVIGEDTMMSGERTITLDEPSYINNDGHVMMPLRAVTEAMYGKAILSWDDDAKSVTILMGSKIINMTVESKSMIVNGSNIQMSSAPELKGGRVFLPLRELGYALGINDSNIKWDESTKTVTIN